MDPRAGGGVRRRPAGILSAMANPDLRYPSSGAVRLGHSAGCSGFGAGVRAALAVWAAPLVLAFVVGLVLLATPSVRIPVFGDPLGAAPGAGGLGRTALGFANLAAVTAVALSRYRLGLACVLTVVPWLLAPLAATMMWGWWLAGLVVLGVAVFDGARRGALWVAASVTTLALVYCTSEVQWNVPLVGPVHLYSRDPGRLVRRHKAVVLGGVPGHGRRRRTDRTARPGSGAPRAADSGRLALRAVAGGARRSGGRRRTVAVRRREPIRAMG